jgi:alpha-L-fucosidase
VLGCNCSCLSVADGDWEADDDYWQSKQFLAWLYNSSPVKDTVVVNDRWGAGDTCLHGGYWTCSDRYQPGKLVQHKWENAFTIDQFSWGYRRNSAYSDYLTVQELVFSLVETVAFGGNMLLNIGPAHDGTIDPIFQDRLLGIGAWLKVNGESIYSSSPWPKAQNETCEGVDVYYTTAAATGDVYAIMLGWPQDNTLTLSNPATSASTQATMLGVSGTLEWTSTGTSGIKVTLPSLNPANLPCQNAWTVKLTNVS